jgi:ribosomal peptide maturation radical SAM protein 1
MKIALVNVPWARIHVPSLQCGLLKSELRQSGHEVDVYYPNLELAARLGADKYKRICGVYAQHNFLGEWLFGTVAFGLRTDDREYLSRSGVRGALDEAKISGDEALLLREEILPAWIDELTEQNPWQSYELIGFTSTFQQNVAALGLARTVKERYPGVITAFGGANFQGEMGMEYMRTFPWIDYAVLGEGDIAFPELVSRLAGQRRVSDVPGVCFRTDGEVAAVPAEPIKDMDAVPVPDYSDYFRVLSRLGRRQALGDSVVRLMYESSRGCWWGAKHHCTFCGLNGIGMSFRSKSPDLVLAELRELAGTYRTPYLDAVDNILDMSYLTSLCTRLGDEAWDVELFYEVKANLSPDQLQMLKSAGVTEIQPGIESLSTHILQLMRKGSTQMINLRLLKWARYFGIYAGWNVLTGFPGETDEDYERQIDLIPSLYHLHPPEGQCPVLLERFSPYFDDRSFPIHDIRPMTEYSYVYPPGVDLGKIAYFFDYTATGTASQSVIERLSAEVKKWQEKWRADERPVLQYKRGPGWLQLVDTRESSRQTVITGWRAPLYEFCGERARTLGGIQEFTDSLPGQRVDSAQIQDFLANCVGERLMAQEDDQYLSLALPAGRRLQFQARPTLNLLTPNTDCCASTEDRAALTSVEATREG